MRESESGTATAPRGRVQKRQAILDAALSVFTREGYGLASIDAIAAEAGVAKPTIYNHLGGKENLFRIVMVEAAEQSRTKILQALDAFPTDATDLRGQLTSLFSPGFIRALPAEQWPRVTIWLRAAGLRLERLANKPARDIELTRQVAPLAAKLPQPFHPARWVLEEWRVQLFAQELRAVGAPSEGKVRAALAE